MTQKTGRAQRQNCVNELPKGTFAVVSLSYNELLAFTDPRVNVQETLIKTGSEQA